MSKSAEQAAELTAQVGFLEEEVSVLRRKLADSPRQVRALEERLAEAQASLAGATGQNDRLVSTLKEARDQIIALKEEVERLAQPPTGYGVFLGIHDDDVGRHLHGRPQAARHGLAGGRHRGAAARPGGHAQRGPQRRGGPRPSRSRATSSCSRRSSRAATAPWSIGHTDEERVVMIADSLLDDPIKAGDSLLLETRSGYVYERIPKSEVEELVLEEVPDIDYSDIGGLSAQIESIRDAVELPFLHKELFKEHQLRPPKGVLLYGPPGCGKTLIAKAVANSPGQEGRRGHGQARGRARTSSTSRARSCSTSTSARPSGRSG